MSIRRLAVAAVLLPCAPAFAASDVSNSGQQANTATGTVAASVASTQTSTIISSAATGGFTGGGGFSAGGSGGFSGGGGSGGFGGGGGSGGFGGSGAGSPGGGGQGGGQGGGSGGFSPGGGGQGNGGQGNQGPQSFNTRTTGVASGDSGNAMGVWGQALYAHVNKSEAFLQMDGSVYNGMVGIDGRFHDRVVAGMAFGYEKVDINTTFNNGTYKADGITVSPYVAVTLTPQWTVDGAVGYTWLNYDTTRQDGAVTGEFNGSRVMLTSNLTGGYASGNWRYQPRASLLYTKEDQNSYTESTGARVDDSSIILGRLSAGGKVGYDIDGILPYAKLMGEWDFKHPNGVSKANGEISSVDDVGAVGGLGVEISSDGITGSLEVDNSTMFRRDLDVWAVIARMRWEM